MSKRIKAASLADRYAFLDAVHRVALLETEKRLIEARRDRALQRINLRFDAKLEPIQQEMKVLTTLAEKYANAYRTELLTEQDVKSVRTALGRYGWRTGNPKTEALSKWTVEKILAALKANLLTAYVRTKEEIDRDKILADGKDGALVNAEGAAIALAAVGLRIGQSEVFYIEPDGDAAQPVKASEAAA